MRRFFSGRVACASWSHGCPFLCLVTARDSGAPDTHTVGLQRPMGSACSSRSARPELSAIVDRGLPPQAKEQHTEQEPRAQDVVTEITDTEFSVGARLRLLESDSHQYALTLPSQFALREPSHP